MFLVRSAEFKREKSSLFTLLKILILASLFTISLIINNCSAARESIKYQIISPSNLTFKLNPHPNQHQQANANYYYGSGTGVKQENGYAAKSLHASQNLLGTCKRVCYFRMDPKTEIRLNQVDGTICTHVILAFARIDAEANLILANESSDSTYLAEVPEFKRRNPGVKVMISLFNEPEFNGFVRLASEQSDLRRQHFAHSAMEFLQRYQLDGLDLDWEFPNFPTTFSMRTRDFERIGLTKIVQALRSAINENFYHRQQAELLELQRQTLNHQLKSSMQYLEPYLLTIAIAAQDTIMRASYEMKQLANLCDWLNVMGYDYYLFKPYAPFTGPNSPLFSVVNNQVPIFNKLSIAWTINKLLNEEQIAPDKIVMGIPTYARAYRLMFRNSVPAPFTLSLGPKGGQIEDYLNFREVCVALEQPGSVWHFDERARVPYLLTDHGSTWISYENEQSVREKVYYILKHKLAGYMTWNLNSDDFVGLKASNSKLPAPANGQQASVGRQAQNGITFSGLTYPLHRAMLDEVFKFNMNPTHSDSPAAAEEGEAD